MYLYGASGHGKVIKEILEAKGEKVDGFIDDNPQVNEIGGIPVFHQSEQKSPMIVSVGTNEIRKRIVETLDCEFATAIHPSSIVSPSVRIGKGSVIMAGGIVNADSRIGNHCIINTGASVDHDCEISDFVHISPHATICGNVEIGEGAWVGAGSVVIQGVKIGKWAIIGAGSVVTRDIPDGVVAFGNPTVVKRNRQEN